MRGRQVQSVFFFRYVVFAVFLFQANGRECTAIYFYTFHQMPFTLQPLTIVETVPKLKLDFQDQRLREKAIETGIADVISKAIGSKIVFQRDRVDEENQEYSQTP